MKKFFKNSFSQKPLVNEQIRAQRVMLIDEQGKRIGLVDRKRALAIARERHFDLIQVTKNVEPPVCKLGDYGKFLYQKQKKEKGKHKESGELKGIRLSLAISDHDLAVRAKSAAKFLKKGNKVRLEMRLRGREKMLQDFARQKITKFLEMVEKSVSYKIDRELKKEAIGLTMIIVKA